MPAYIALDLMQPPDYATAVSGTSTTVLPSGTQSASLNLEVSPSNALGLNRLRVSLVSEAGQTLAVQQRDLTVQEMVYEF